MYCLRDCGRFIKRIVTSTRKGWTTTKKAEVLPLLGIGYDDIIGIVWLSSFYS